jgi:multiple sugar transport system ATP-binding protein
MACISLAGVSHTYPGGIKAVNDLDLEVFDGELLVLLGPSGCGKSTTLRLIAGLESPSAGTIRLHDRDANRTPPHDRDVAMLFQEEALYPHLSVRDNLGFSLQARRRGWLRWRRDSHGESALAVRQRVERAAGQLGLADLLDRPPGALSGGQRQRVALGRVLVRDAGIWLLDEPFAHVDARLRTELRRTLQTIHRERPRTTMVYVTHDQAEALALADRVAVMKNGRIEQIGTPREVYENPKNAFVAGFVGDPPMNLLSGEVFEEHLDLVQGCGWSWPLADGGTWLDRTLGYPLFVIGFRAEDLTLEAATSCSSPSNELGSGRRRLGVGQVVDFEWYGGTAYTAVEFGDAPPLFDPSEWCWVKSDLQAPWRLGDTVQVQATGKAYWFDGLTGVLI